MANLVIQKAIKTSGVSGWAADSQYTGWNDWPNSGLPTPDVAWNVPAAVFGNAGYTSLDTDVEYVGFSPFVNVVVDLFSWLSSGSTYGWTVKCLNSDALMTVSYTVGAAQKDTFTAVSDATGKVKLRFHYTNQFIFPAAIRLTGESASGVTPPATGDVYGDSIFALAGGHVSNDNNLAWKKLGLSLNIDFSGHAVAGTTMPEIAKTIWGAVPNNAFNILEGGANDQRLHVGEPNYITDWGKVLLAAASQLAIPDSKKTLGDAATITGTWSASTLMGTHARKSTANLATIEAVVFGDKAIVCYAGYAVGTANKDSSVEVYVDNVLKTTISGVFLTDLGGMGYSAQALFLSGMGEGVNHTVKLKIVSVAGKEFTLQFISGYPTVANNYTNTLLFLNVPPQFYGYPFGGNSTNLALFNAEKASVDAKLVGLRSVPVDVTNIGLVQADSDDGIHFYDSGHLKIFNAMLAATGSVPKLLSFGAINIILVPTSIKADRKIAIPAQVNLPLTDNSFVVCRYNGLGHANAGTYAIMIIPFTDYVPALAANFQYDYVIGRREGIRFINYLGAVST